MAPNRMRCPTFPRSRMRCPNSGKAMASGSIRGPKSDHPTLLTLKPVEKKTVKSYRPHLLTLKPLKTVKSDRPHVLTLNPKS